MKTHSFTDKKKIEIYKQISSMFGKRHKDTCDKSTTTGSMKIIDHNWLAAVPRYKPLLFILVNITDSHYLSTNNKHY